MRMPMKRSRVGLGRRLSVWLALGAVLTSPTVFAQSGAPQVSHDPIGCFIAGQNALVQAGIQPVASVAKARVFFRSSLGNDFFYVEMKQDATGFSARLPRPRVGSGPLVYYIEATSRDFGAGRSAEAKGVVVAKPKECPGDLRVAAAAPGGAVAVFTAAGTAIGAPAGFAGAAVVAAGVTGVLGSTAGIVALSAVGVGAVTATAVALTSNDNPSPSQ
jgi:hypothetical protein